MSPSAWKLCAVVVVAVPIFACEARRDKEGLGTTAITSEALATSAGDQDRAEAPQGRAKRGFVQNIEELTVANDDFRRVIYTAPNLQLVLMSIPAREHIGIETHDVDQFFRVESGTGRVMIDGAWREVGPETAIVIPGGARHDIVAGEKGPLKVYTLYAPPQHRDGVVHRTRAEAEADEEKFDGRTTE